ncbi:unnamed protein product, partial [Oppiella nova]
MILRIVGISEPTYYEWCKIDDQELPFITVSRAGGRDRITEPEDDQSLRDAALANNWGNLNELRQLPEIQGNANIAAASGRTLRRRLSDQGVRHRVAAIKERLRDFHKERRLIYAEQFVNWTLVDWSRVIFIDEFGISTGEGGRVWVWRTRGTRYDERNIRLIQRTQRFSVSFIASFHGIGPIYRLNRLTKESYSDYLESSILPEIDRHFDDGNVHLLHDNHPVHKSNLVRDWINENIGPIEDFVLPHPGLSPDLNACENVGAMIKNLVRTERQAIESEDQLWEA